ncbi:MAG: FHA domain-containing protein [Planctomycetota bacterium]|nr:MAG: FHA domain-containing protein [Planctomycetota bacterium]
MPSIRIKNGPNAGMRFEIKEDVLGIGRDDEEDIQIFDQGVSRRHAEIFRVGEMYFIRDLGSKNGTFVNGEKITEELLRAGDEVRIGGALLEFEEGEAEGSSGRQKKIEIVISSDLPNFSGATGLYRFNAPTIEDTYEPMQEGEAESRDMEALYEVAKIIRHGSDPHELMKEILQFALPLVEADCGYIFLRKSLKKKLTLVCSHERQRMGRPLVSKNVIKRVMRSRKSFLGMDHRTKEGGEVEEYSVLCVCLVAFEELSGVMYLAKKKKNGPFTRENMELITAIGVQLGVALQGLRAAHSQRRVFLNMVKMLVRAIEMRVPQSKGHSEEVANYATAIALSMGLDRESVRRIQLASLLHGLGRIAIPDAEMGENLKNREEHIYTKQAFLAEELLREYEGMEELIDGVKYHRENVDGSGYPEGRKGKEIPLDARIIAVAKAFARNYAPSKGRAHIKEVLLQLQKQADILYDKKVIQGLIVAYRTGKLFQKIPLFPDL